MDAFANLSHIGEMQTYRSALGAVESGDDSDGPGMPKADAKSLAQRELRLARGMSVASLLLGATSVAMMAAVMTRRAGLLQPRSSVAGVVGLAAASETEEEHAEGQGWYRTYLNSIVRKEEGMESEKLQVVPAGDLVYVAEAKGRRARILKPILGWVSLQTEEGIQILRPDMAYSASTNRTAMEDAFGSRSQELRQASERLKGSVAKMTAVEKKLTGMLKHLGVEGQRLRRTAGHATQRAPKIGEALAKQATHVFKRTVKPEGAKGFLDHLRQGSHAESLKQQDLVRKMRSQAGEVKRASETKREASSFGITEGGLEMRAL